MPDPGPELERIERLDEPFGDDRRDLAVGPWAIRLEGLDGGLADALDARWGGFVGPAGPAEPRLRVQLVRGDGAGWLEPWRAGEVYRVEAVTAGGIAVVRSYHFALAPRSRGTWRLVVERSPREPVGRVLDNAARYLVAHLALEAGGLALHGAAVRRAGRAHVFAGPSGSGKTTAVRHSAPAESLGDDFALVLRAENGWVAAAVPFDNAETAPVGPVRELVPLAGVWRLFHARAHGIERPDALAAQASILSCAAFATALPDFAERSKDAVGRLAASGLYGHLHFAPDAGFWKLIEPPA